MNQRFDFFSFLAWKAKQLPSSSPIWLHSISSKTFVNNYFILIFPSGWLNNDNETTIVDKPSVPRLLRITDFILSKGTVAVYLFSTPFSEFKVFGNGTL